MNNSVEQVGQGLRVWESLEAACKRLEVSPRTLRRMVAKGQIERRQDGRRAFYCIAATPGTAAKSIAPSTIPARSLTSAKASKDIGHQVPILEGALLLSELVKAHQQIGALTFERDQLARQVLDLQASHRALQDLVSQLGEALDDGQTCISR